MPILSHKNNRGFTLIEVLVATLIMVVSIVTVSAAIRQFAMQREKLASYERIHTTVLSLRDQIMNDTLSDGGQASGTLNGVPYRYQARLVEQGSNYVMGNSEVGIEGGNKGNWSIRLFQVNLEVDQREFQFYKTQYLKLHEETDARDIPPS